MNDKLRKIIGTVLLVIGIGILLVQSIPIYQSYQNANAYTINDVSTQTTTEAVFDSDGVTTATPEAVAAAREAIANGNAEVNILGAIAIPDAGVHTTIGEGMAEHVLLTGAGTYKPDQKMGQGNYALLAHRMNPVLDIMFNNLEDHVAIGQNIYITDTENIYVYKTYFNEVVTPNQVHHMDPELRHNGNPVITLQTCTVDLANRVIVHGELTEVIAFENADQEILDYFN